MKLQAFILLSLLSFYSFCQKESYQLVVNVQNIKNLKGTLKFGVYNVDDDFLKKAVSWGDVIIDKHSAKYVFNDLDRGIYAVSIYQDENDNGELDANFFGVPTEPYAFSNNAKGKFGPPSFEDCKFEVQDSTEIIIEL